MYQHDSKTSTDTRLDMSEMEEGVQKLYLRNFGLCPQNEIALDKDIREPDSMARDIAMEQFTNNLPKLKDFGEAANLIMNTTKYSARIEKLLEYERNQFFNQRGALGNYTNSNFCPTKDVNMKPAITESCIKYNLYADPLQIIYGPLLLMALENIIDAFEGKDDGENNSDYEYRRNHTAVEFINSFFHLKNYLLRNNETEKSFSHNVKIWLVECVQEGNTLAERKQYKKAADRYLDGAFACMCILHHENDKTINILGSVLQTNDKNSLETSSVKSFDTSDTESITNTETSSESFASENSSIHEENNEVGLYVYLLDLQIKAIECWIDDMQLKRASSHINHLMQWMCKKQINGRAGYLAIQYTEKFCKLLSYVGKADYLQSNTKAAIIRVSNAIEKYFDIGHNLINFEARMFEERKTIFKRLVYDFMDDKVIHNENTDSKLTINSDVSDVNRSRAKILVDLQRKKGLINNKTQFVVNDIDSAIRIAKDGDTIFLEEGAYIGGQFGEKKNKIKEQFIEVNKNIEIVGAKTSRVHLIGSVIKKSPGTVIFRNLTFENSISSNSKGSIYAMSGKTEIIDCCIKSSAKTAIHVVSNDAYHDTVLKLNFCVMDGMNICERLLGFEGLRPVISVEDCYVTNALSFCVVFAPAELECTVEMTITNCLFISVQDGIKIIVHHESLVPPKVIIRGCHFELTTYRTNDGSPSIAFCQTGGAVELENNYINMLEHTVPTTGFSLHSLTVAKIRMNMIASTEKSRLYSVSKGMLITECKKTEIESIEIEGMRVGIKFANNIDNEINTARIENCSIKCCSLGILISKSDNYAENIKQNEQKTKSSLGDKKKQNEIKGDNDDGNILVSSPSKLCEIISKQVDFIDPNIYMKMSGCLFDTLYYGVMNETPKGQISLEENIFQNVPKAVILNHDCLDTYKVELSSNDFRLTEMFNYSDIDFHDSKQVESLRRALYIQFSLHENIPCRIAYEGKDYFVVSSKFDESFLFENNLASSIVVSDEDQSEEDEKDKSNYKEMV